jgi:hypothetical protein
MVWNKYTPIDFVRYSNYSSLVSCWRGLPDPACYVVLLYGGGGLEHIDVVKGELRPPRREVVIVGEQLWLLVGTIAATIGTWLLFTILIDLFSFLRRSRCCDKCCALVRSLDSSKVKWVGWAEEKLHITSSVLPPDSGGIVIDVATAFSELELLVSKIINESLADEGILSLQVLLLFILLFIPQAEEAVVPGVTALVILLDLGVLVVMVELDIFVIVVTGKSASFTLMSL